jgi:hypothetical protein
VEVYLHVFITPTLHGNEWLDSRPGRFILEERTQFFSGKDVGIFPGMLTHKQPSTEKNVSFNKAETSTNTGTPVCSRRFMKKRERQKENEELNSQV